MFACSQVHGLVTNPYVSVERNSGTRRAFPAMPSRFQKRRAVAFPKAEIILCNCGCGPISVTITASTDRPARPVHRGVRSAPNRFSADAML
jgi:hypothetical protein